MNEDRGRSTVVQLASDGGSVGSRKNFSVYLQHCFYSTFLFNASICFYLLSDLPDDLKEQ